MQINYEPPGPVARAFHESDAFFRGLKGPVGSGKSSTCCVELFRRATEQDPDHTNTRRTRWVVIRNTYPELKSTTIKTFMDWFGDLCTIRWDAPITANLYMGDIGDGTSMHMEVYFLAMDKPEDAGKLKSLEVTGGFVNEASEIDKSTLDMLTTRVGRFPAVRNGGPTWRGIIADTNPPDDDHWWYKLAVEEPAEGYEFFDQPGGLMKVDEKWVPNPAAENVANLVGGYDYYLKQVAAKDDRFVSILIGGQYGTTMDGKPVYPEWNDAFHLSKNPLKWNPLAPLYVSFDFGLTPACAVTQLSPKGQLLVFRELVSEDMGIRQFYGDVVRPFLAEQFPRASIEFVGDPAGINRSQNDAKSCFEEMRELGAACQPASTNVFLSRREAVAYFLTRSPGGEPGFLLDPSCKTLRRGFNGGYRFERLKVSGTSRFRDRPVKDRFSHPHDALQYGALHARGDATPVRRREIKVVSMAGHTR